MILNMYLQVNYYKYYILPISMYIQIKQNTFKKISSFGEPGGALSTWGHRKEQARDCYP